MGNICGNPNKNGENLNEAYKNNTKVRQ